MKVINHEPHFWYLLEDQEKLFIDVNCNHSFFDYTFTIQLNEKEIKDYKEIGVQFLNKLAEDIHSSAPALSASDSIYKERKVSDQLTESIDQTIENWIKQKNETT